MNDSALPDAFEPFVERGKALMNEHDADGVSYASTTGGIGEIPKEIQTLLDERGPNGGARHPKLVARWNGDASGLGDDSASNFDQSLVTLIALPLIEDLGLDLGDEEHTARIGGLIEQALKRRRADSGIDTKDRRSYWDPTISRGLSRALEMRQRDGDVDTSGGAALGAEAFVHLAIAGSGLRLIARLADVRHLPAMGGSVTFGFAPDAVRIFDPAGKRIELRLEQAERVREPAHV